MFNGVFNEKSLNFLKSYDVVIKEIVIHEDNEAVLKLVKGTKPMNDLSKHMEIQRLFIKDTIEQEKMTLIFCRSDDMLAHLVVRGIPLPIPRY